MEKQKLGGKKPVLVRDVFPHEAEDFTPWLSKNIDLLSDELHLEIIDPNTEVSVGNFSCDIEAKDAGTGKIVIIENQFGTTDHDHLGKIFTYAAGRDAKIIIWVAEEFREEHRKTLEWLNEQVNPDSGPSFIGVKIRLFKIDESNPIVDFDVIVQPNDWQRKIKIQDSSSVSETGKKYLEFFSQLIAEYGKTHPNWKKGKASTSSWYQFSAGKSGLWYMWSFRNLKRVSVELYIDTGDRSKNEVMFDYLYNKKSAIETIVPGLSWERLDGKRACRIPLYHDIKGPMRDLTYADFPEILEWMVSIMPVFQQEFSKHIKLLLV